MVSKEFEVKKIYTVECEFYFNNRDCEDGVILGVFSTKKRAKERYRQIIKSLKIKKNIKIRSIPIDVEFWNGGFSTYKHIEEKRK